MKPKRKPIERILMWDMDDLQESNTSDGTPPHLFFRKHFKGNCYDLFYDLFGNVKTRTPRNWAIKIVDHCTRTDGSTETFINEYSPEDKMCLSDLCLTVEEHWKEHKLTIQDEFPQITSTVIAKCRA